MNPQDGPLKEKTSFYYPLLLLPPKKRGALEALYRFCWAADEIADSRDPLPSKQKKLANLKSHLAECFRGRFSLPIFKNLGKAIEDFKLTPPPLLRILRGVERDLRPVRFQTFQELHRYALLVAGGPGLSSMEIFGFKDARHRSYAENLGVFLQIVNVVRDFKEDLAMGRRYLPSEDFKRFHLDPTHIEERDSHWKPFVEFQLDRAWTFLKEARKSLTLKERGALGTAEAIAAVYVKLHQKLRNQPDLILGGRVSLSKGDKLLSALGAAGRCLIWRLEKNK